MGVAAEEMNDLHLVAEEDRVEVACVDDREVEEDRIHCGDHYKANPGVNLDVDLALVGGVAVAVDCKDDDVADAVVDSSCRHHH